MSPYKLVFEKSCHLPIEFNHKTYWAIKKCNMNLDDAGMHRKLQLQHHIKRMMKELRNGTYENTTLYKEKTKIFHDQQVAKKSFVVRQRVLLYQSHLKLFPDKLRSCWVDPFVVINVFHYDAVKI